MKARFERDGDDLVLVFPDGLAERLGLKEGDSIDSEVIEAALQRHFAQGQGDRS